jgi:hypothetical protein
MTAGRQSTGPAVSDTVNTLTLDLLEPRARVLTVARRPAVKRVCGVCGETRRIHIRGRDGRPDMCQRCAPRTAVCGVCGRASRIALTALGDRPAVGRCRYQSPVATCSQCGHERPCNHSGTDRPVCLACAPRRLSTCGVCGRMF